MDDAYLIDLVYRAAMSGDWQSVVSALARAGGDICSHIYGHDLQTKHVNVAGADGYDPARLGDYDSHYHALNCWVPGMAKAIVGKATSSQSYCSDDVVLRSEFYNDWIRPQEAIGAGGGVVLFNDDARFVVIGGNMRFKDRDTKEAPWLGLLDRLAPHLRRAFDIQMALQNERIVSRGYLDVIEMIGNAVFLIDRRGRIQFQNKAAAGMFSSPLMLWLDGSGCLRLRDIAADRVLKAGLTAITQKRHEAFQGVFPIRQSADRRPYAAVLAPFVTDQDRTGLFADFISDKVPVAILTITDHGIVGYSQRQMLAMTYGLTPSEADLAIALGSGANLQDYADRRTTSIHTVRNQLKSIFDKTDTRRQGELVALIAKLVL